MPKIVPGLILFSVLTFNAIAQSTFYVASKSGLNLRQNPDPGSAVITKIPYGSKVTKAAGDPSSFTLETEGMNASWQRVLFEGRPGYVADVYLLPFMPPVNHTCDDPEGYLKTLSKETGRSVKKATDSYEGEQTVTRVLFENGMAYRYHSGYEYHAYTIWIPYINMHRGFVLARLLSNMPKLLSTGDAFPVKSVKGSETVHNITVEYRDHWLTAIRFDWCEGGCYTVEIRDEEGEISITFSGGV